DVDVRDLFLTQVARETRRRAPALVVPVVAEAAVRVDRGIRALANDRADALPVEVAVQLGAVCARDEVVRPEHLLAPVERDRLERLSARVPARERNMIRRMPVLCRNEEAEQVLVEHSLDRP